MSKYEPRSENMQKTAAIVECKLSWTRRKNKIYLTVKSIHAGVANTVICFAKAVQLDTMDGYILSWYTKTRLTSQSHDHRTYIVRDIWEELKK